MQTQFLKLARDNNKILYHVVLEAVEVVVCFKKKTWVVVNTWAFILAVISIFFTENHNKIIW